MLRPHRDRITWDAPIHSWADVEALPFAPRCLNVKPSRFGSLERLFEFYDRCAEHGIALYGGGQFELGPGRGQIQLLASLFSAEGPNDVAPGGYNDPEPRPGLETSPLDPRPEPTGFRRASELWESGCSPSPSLGNAAPSSGLGGGGGVGRAAPRGAGLSRGGPRGRWRGSPGRAGWGRRPAGARAGSGGAGSGSRGLVPAGPAPR